MAVWVLRVVPLSHLPLYKKEARFGSGLKLIGQVTTEREVTREAACGITPGETAGMVSSSAWY